MPSPTGEERFFGQPRAEKQDRECPAAVVTGASLLTAEPADESASEAAPLVTVVRAVSLIDSGELPGDTQRLDPPRPPPVVFVRNV